MVESLQARQRLVDRDHIDRILDARDGGLVQRCARLAGAVLQPRSAARALDQDSSHRFRCGGKEMSAVLPTLVGIPDQAQVGFVHQCRRLPLALLDPEWLA